jgi:hypothetical protein
MPIRRFTILVTAMLGLIAVALPATAHDPDFHEHGATGSQSQDLYSSNMQLMSNAAPTRATMTQSDLAFWGEHAIAGDYGGFRILDISDPGAPTVVSDFACNGAQSDVSVWGDLLFQSVDQPQTHGGCDSSATRADADGMFEGVRIFDISDVTAPAHVASIPTDCGSHTHTLLPDPDNDQVYVYVSSYPLGGAAIGPACGPPHEDPELRDHGFVSVITVPLDDPGAATVDRAFLDEDTATATYFDTFSFTACHDISVFKELNLAAGACMSEAQLWDISDPLQPELLWRFDHPIVDPAKIDLWHSATFNWDGSIVAFGDESGGGGAARCQDPDDLQGRIWFLDLKSGELLANYKVPRSESGICTMHNFNFLPLRDGRNVLVSSAYTAGTSVVNVDRLIATGDEAASEIGYARPHGGSSWSSYWYNGFIYSNDIFRGVDTFMLSGKERAGARKLPYLNPQTQMSVIR